MSERNKLISKSIMFIVVFLLLDQITKYMIYSTMHPYETVNVITGFFNLIYAKNPGSAFSFLADSHPEFRRPFFIIVPSIAIVVIIYMLRNSIKNNNKYESYGFALIIGGALGNLLDRFTYGDVIDFLQVFYGSIYWPAFNVADISITSGISVLVLYMISSELKNKSKAKPKK